MKKTENHIRTLIMLFMISLGLSGVTAFFLETELAWLVNRFNFGETINQWLEVVYFALKEVNETHPFMSYGYDWLAFGHLVIALFFIGPYRAPVQNQWVIHMGFIACFAIFPLAFIAGYFREIPMLWQLIDCSFGVFGALLLYIINKKINQLKRIKDLKSVSFQLA